MSRLNKLETKSS